MDDAVFVQHVTIRFRNSAYYVGHTLYLRCSRITVQSFQVQPKGECFINTPIENYEQMKIIFGKPRVENPLAVNMLQLALSYLMDHEEERFAYLAGTEADRKKWYFAYYHALFRAMG